MSLLKNNIYLDYRFAAILTNLMFGYKFAIILELFENYIVLKVFN